MTDTKRPTLFLIQEIIPHYRGEVIKSLSEFFDLTVLADFQGDKSGHRYIDQNSLRAQHCKNHKILSGLLYYQAGVLSKVFTHRPNHVLTFVHSRSISFWLLLVTCRVLGISLHCYGHGPFKKDRNSLVWRIIYRAILKLCTGFICYNDYAAKHLRQFAPGFKNIHKINNTIRSSKSAPEIKSGSESGLLFVGRLREGSDISLLIAASDCVRHRHQDLSLHIIGSGPLLEPLRTAYRDRSWIHFYGDCYDDDEIANISKRCKAGIYPGRAGLSIVHYLSLSLPVIVFKELNQHMGPEPAYIQPNINGLMFEMNNIHTLSAAIEQMLSTTGEEYSRMSTNAYNTYASLTSETFGQQFSKIIETK